MDENKIDSTDPSYELHCIRHSAAHIMAHAVQQMFPEAKFAIGPVIKDCFYYDIDLPRPITEEDLTEIEKRMKDIIKSNNPIGFFNDICLYLILLYCANILSSYIYNDGLPHIYWQMTITHNSLLHYVIH